MRFKLETEYITLQQLLKACDVVSSGGEAKAYLACNVLYVNGQEENRRGRKIRKNDVVTNDEGLRIEVE
ncbi:S4 domain-containing protein YaaA [Floccifex sp.]|uniref:S4 domain-containing protein YaaA n=1 Tax=Floccifex sp. TaxID=2815810 RepID=UPI0029FF20EF|nr:S4 domain-containing protein YaaA [Floccifex sp.]MDD7280472.1 S4 domain-containing protein YaaA [Erysipelotrichaceae bacterium]MDY2958681.1 S4 domain-containing protein YaaA [Floccifex sp.]